MRPRATRLWGYCTTFHGMMLLHRHQPVEHSGGLHRQLLPIIDQTGPDLTASVVSGRWRNTFMAAPCPGRNSRRPQESGIFPELTGTTQRIPQFGKLKESLTEWGRSWLEAQRFRGSELFPH